METVIFRDCTYIDKKIYFFSEMDYLPIVMDTLDNTEKILPVKNRESYRKVLFDLVTGWGKKIYALEMSGQYMCEYSLDTYEATYIKIDCYKKIDGNFALIAADKNQVYIFDRFSGLTVYDIHSKNVYKKSYPYAECEVITGCKYQDKYYLFPRNGNKVFRYDVLLEKWDTLYLMEKWHHAIHVAVDKDNILLLLEDGTIIEWDTKGKINIINATKECYKSDRAASRICVTDNSFIILPSLENDILIFDKKSQKVEVMQDYPKDFKYVNNNWTKYYGYCETEDFYIIACRKSDYILKIRKSNNGFEWIRSEIESEKLVKCKVINKMYIKEKKGNLRYLIKNTF